MGRSERLRTSTPSLGRILLNTINSFSSSLLHSTNVMIRRTQDKNRNNNNNHFSSTTKQTDKNIAEQQIDQKEQKQPFTVDCSWSTVSTTATTHCNNQSTKDGNHDKDRSRRNFAQWATERYFVYTQKYGMNWQGQVKHKPWPVEEATVTNLEMSGVDDSYEPKTMRPILKYMSTN